MKKDSLFSKEISFISLILILLSSNIIIIADKNQMLMDDTVEAKEQIENFPYIANGAADLELNFRNVFWFKQDLIGDAISSPTITDLDGDGNMELIILTGNSIIYILDHNGNFVSGWGEPGIVGTNEQLTSDLGVSPYPLAIDLNNDGKKEIMVATFNPGTIQAWFLNTTVVPGWDITLNDKITSSLAAGDIDGDGDQEIVIGTWGGEIHAFELNGSEVKGFPYTGPSDQIIGTPALSDIDGKIGLEIIFSSYDYSIYAINGSGILVPGWPQTASYLVRASPAIVDLNNDSKKEIIIGSWDSNLYIYQYNGTPFGSWPWDSGCAILNSATITDLDLDGYFDFLIQPSNVTLFAFTDARNSKNYYWTHTQTEMIFEDAVIANLDRDPYPEILEVTRTGKVIIYSHNGTQLLNQLISDKGFISAPAIGDIDRDGYIEIIFATRGEGITREFSDIYCYKINAFGLLPWPSYRGGNERIGKPSDNDNDGLSNQEEDLLGTDKLNPDTDGDSIKDGAEIYRYYLDPTKNDLTTDTDNDLLTNVDEVDIYKTDPLQEDTDNDELTDSYEIFTSLTDPNDFDTDDDLLPDGFEVMYSNPNPFVPDTFEDLDEDDLNNFEEYTHETNPDLPDTDGDGLLDGDEVKKYLTNPNVQDADLDSDGDGLTNVEEIDIYGTSPINDDTDGDGYSDSEEIRRGSNPLDPRSKPFPLWSLAPIIGGSLIILGTVSYFVIKKIQLKRRGMV